MVLRPILILLLLPFLAADGDKDGRRGNEHYTQQQYDLAVEAYYAGLASLKDSAKPWLRYALQNNLGAALLKTGDAAAAREAFARAIASAPSPADAARTEYNSGNAAFEGRDLQQALNHYRESLLKNPENADAKFNYEYVKRQLQQQQNQQQQNQNNQDKGDQEQESRNEGDQEQQQQQDQQQKPGSQNQDGKPEQSQDPQQADQPGEEQREQQPPQNEAKLSQQQAERILEAMENEEEQLLRQVQRMKAKPKRVEKDW